MLEPRAETSIQKHAKSFALASRFLPKRSFEDVCWLYSLCRHIDDVADEGDPVDAVQELSRLKMQIESENPSCQWALLYQRLMCDWGLEKKPLLDLIAGAESDLTQPIVQSERELLLYCYRVAGTVGWMMCPLIGVKKERAIPYAIDLGVAMQLTNICRDIKEDWLRGRIYLPSLTKDDIESERGSSERLVAVEKVKAVLRMTEQYYQSGIRGCRFIPGLARLSICIAICLYRGIGRKILNNQTDPFENRSYLNRSEKFLAVLQGFGLWFVSMVWPLKTKSTPLIGQDVLS